MIVLTHREAMIDAPLLRRNLRTATEAWADSWDQYCESLGYADRERLHWLGSLVSTVCRGIYTLAPERGRE